MADLLLVDGDPVADVRLLQQTDKLVGIFKGGVAHKLTVGARVYSNTTRSSR